jgi:hypothetical protein
MKKYCLAVDLTDNAELIASSLEKEILEEIDDNDI